MAQRTDERRVQPRHPYRTELYYRPSELHVALALELSDGGIGLALATDEPLAVGTELELFLINKYVQINGVVKDVTRLPDGNYRVGVSFTKPEPELVQVLLAAESGRLDTLDDA